jgi:hypothetical protein
MSRGAEAPASREPEPRRSQNMIKRYTIAVIEDGVVVESDEIELDVDREHKLAIVPQHRDAITLFSAATTLKIPALCEKS